MPKKIVLTISLIFSVLALIYMFLVHYGLMRHFYLHVYSCESYLEKYLKLPKAEGRVVVHFHGLGKNMKAFINSILDQNIRVDEISMSIPYKDMGKIPEWVNKIVSVSGYSVKYGEEGKIVPVVLNEGEADTKIIVVDPSHTYGKDFIQELLAKHEENPQKIIQSNGTLLITPNFFTENIATYKNSNFDQWLEHVANTGKIKMKYSENFRCF